MNLTKHTETGLVTGLFLSTANGAPSRQVTFKLGGMDNDPHHGVLRASGGREKKIMAQDTPCFNLRQVSIVSAEELAATADSMGIDHLEAAWISSNMCVRGLTDFSQLPIGTVLKFSSGAQLFLTLQNVPCAIPAREIARHLPFGDEEKARFFAKAAIGRRGMLAIVLVEGDVVVGDTIEVWLPQKHIPQ